MTPEQQAVKEWMEVIEPRPSRPTQMSQDDGFLRYYLIDEELKEYLLAFASGELVAQADALGDLLVVVYGAAVQSGIDLEQVFNEIMRSNWTKFGPNKEVAFNEVGKIMKGPSYDPPHLEEVIDRQIGADNPRSLTR